MESGHWYKFQTANNRNRCITHNEQQAEDVYIKKTDIAHRDSLTDPVIFKMIQIRTKIRKNKKQKSSLDTQQDASPLNEQLSSQIGDDPINTQSVGDSSIYLQHGEEEEHKTEVEVAGM